VVRRTAGRPSSARAPDTPHTPRSRGAQRRDLPPGARPPATAAPGASVRSRRALASGAARTGGGRRAASPPDPGRGRRSAPHRTRTRRPLLPPPRAAALGYPFPARGASAWPARRTRGDPPACAAARATHRRTHRHTAHPRTRRSPSPRPGPPVRSAQTHGWPYDLRSPPGGCRRSRPTPAPPTQPCRTASAPRRTTRPTPPRAAPRTSRSSRDQAPRSP
jgi:hypothetical protein